MEEHVVAIGNGKPVLLMQSFRGPYDQGEKSLSPRWEVDTVLDIAIRPEPFGGGVSF
jgi:hypothetical protein